MDANAAHGDRIDPNRGLSVRRGNVHAPDRQNHPTADVARASPGSSVAALSVREFEGGAGILIPRPEIHLVVRFGSAARDGLDVHAFGVRERVHRKVIRNGQRTVTARLRLGAPDAVLGVPASEMAGRTVGLEELWGQTATQRLRDRLAGASDGPHAAAVLESAIAERLQRAEVRHPHTRLALAAAERLTTASVNVVAMSLGVSERQLRRVFLETIGVSPKAFARLTRFRRALQSARDDANATWASIAVANGYYDQAHLITEFRVIAGVTPRALLGELRTSPSIG